MALEDFIPNVFGQAPTGYEGLLGADRTQALQKTANLQGLLGAASALAQGMSGQGARRSALQNILGAVSGGYQGAQGAYQQGLQQFSNMQTIEQAQLAKQQAALLRADVEKVMQMPEVANNPALVASLRADPAKALAFINENLPVSQAYQTAPQGQPAPQPAGMPSAIPAINPADGQVLAPVPVSAKVSPLQTQKDRLLSANQRLTGVPGKMAQEAIKNNIDQITAIDKQLMQESVSSFDFNSLKGTVAPDLLPQVNNLQRLAETGQISASDLQAGLKEIQKADFDFKKDQRDYNKEAVRVAGSMFPNTPLSSLSPQQLGELQSKLDQLEIAKRKAGATTINMPSESERTAGFLTNRVQNSLAQLQSVTGTAPTAASPNFSAEVIKNVTRSDYLKNLANPETRQQVEAAQLEILDAALTLGTGAAYTNEQLNNYRKSYFPQLGDKPATIADKAARLKNMLDSAMIKAGRAAPNSVPQIDVDAAVRLELDRRKGK